MFISHNKVRMHDTDMAGILYFPRQFRFCHDALEDLVEEEGFSFDKVFHSGDFVFVIVHAESDYYAPVRVGDKLEVHTSVEHIGSSSFSVKYNIFTANKTLIGSAKTVHVTLSRDSREKISIPDGFRLTLKKYIITK